MIDNIRETAVGLRDPAMEHAPVCRALQLFLTVGPRPGLDRE
jgi:hypothetical protein